MWIKEGIGPILRAFLPKLEKFGGGVSLLPSTREIAAWADGTLLQSWQLAMLRRLAHAEQYGLVRCDVHSAEFISISIIVQDVEALDRAD